MTSQIRFSRRLFVAGAAVVAVAPPFASAAGERPQPTGFSLTAQLAGLAADVINALANDAAILNQKLQFGLVAHPNLPSSNYALPMEKDLKRLLAEHLVPKSDFVLSAVYDEVLSETDDNQGFTVIQITLTIADRRRKPLAQFTREVNDTGDQAKIMGLTVSPPDTDDFAKRNEMLTEASREPKFETHAGTGTQIVASDPKYAVEIRKSPGGRGAAAPIAPTKHPEHPGMPFVPIDIGDTYEVALFNFDDQRDAVVDLTIDGLQAINEFNEDRDAKMMPVKYPGYLVPRATGGKPGVHVVPGWMRTVKQTDEKGKKVADNVFQFVVNELGKGAASARGARGGIGVITASFMGACRPDESPKTIGRSFGETGKGKGLPVGYELVEVQINTDPRSIVSVRYTRSP